MPLADFQQAALAKDVALVQLPEGLVGFVHLRDVSRSDPASRPAWKSDQEAREYPLRPAEHTTHTRASQF